MDAWDQAKLIEKVRENEEKVRQYDNMAYYVKVTREENERLKKRNEELEARFRILEGDKS